MRIVISFFIYLRHCSTLLFPFLSIFFTCDHACAHRPHHIPNTAPWWMNYHYSNEKFVEKWREKKVDATNSINFRFFIISQIHLSVCHLPAFSNAPIESTISAYRTGVFSSFEAFRSQNTGMASWRVFNCPAWRTHCIKWYFSLSIGNSPNGWSWTHRICE